MHGKRNCNSDGKCFFPSVLYHSHAYGTGSLTRIQVKTQRESFENTSCRISAIGKQTTMPILGRSSDCCEVSKPNTGRSIFLQELPPLTRMKHDNSEEPSHVRTSWAAEFIIKFG